MSISTTNADLSQGNLPPATPSYILRGHKSTVHALKFFSNNQYLASADAEGWAVIWSLVTKRAVAVWRAHKGSILSVQNWGHSILITHGRDHSLRVWQIRESDFENLHKTLPAQQIPGETGQEPWVLHSLSVNALNFCAFATYDLHEDDNVPLNIPKVDLPIGTDRAILIGCPNALDSGGIDLFHLPSERRIARLESDREVQTGMVMALKLIDDRETGELNVISGYEDGHVMVHTRLKPTQGQDWEWRKVYMSRAHSQPVLSLDVSLDADFLVSCAADALIVKHPLVGLGSQASGSPIKCSNTKHAGQQGLSVRDDGKIFATAGWDARIRVYSAKNLREVAALKWHSEGCYCTGFAETKVHLASETSGELRDHASAQSSSALARIVQKRLTKAQQTHWLAAGSKDGKISLWDIY